MKFVQMFPLWFWMVLFALIVIPISYRIARRGVKIAIETKLGSAEVNVGDEEEDKDADKKV